MARRKSYPSDLTDEQWAILGPLVCPRLGLVWADGAYGRNGLPEWTEQARGWRLEIVGRPADARGLVVGPRRWTVEGTFGWLLRNRRLSKDYEELAATTEAWVYAGMTRLLLRRLTPEAA